ncbi:hypothetical protein LZF95_02440 [Algoriphagus sp. AGSA1]|uniref:hypothetical protein n=1 Tax=Algoriphagus sp. AGSA1 TaxID=2907213 RepID=UPI001F2D3222|nr:hypothetical protein [Algoriphagus sp. AGSA1]MCE7053520.1 hypothetical protein [Algoriphagus sp. AGSA1]
MKNFIDPKSQSSNSEKNKLFNGLMKSVLGIVVILFLLLGLIVFLIIQPDLSGVVNSGSEVPKAELPESGFSTSSEVVDGKDMETGLIASKGLELVKANCTNCHSSALILQNRFTREDWHAKIVWMQETQGLWELGESESLILDYLAENYAPEAPKGRRIPLSGIEWYELKD